jgi:hypothetical protein
VLKIHVRDAEAARNLVRFFRARDYLAVADLTGVVDVAPIATEGEEADRERTLRDLAAWCADHRGVEVRVDS